MPGDSPRDSKIRNVPRITCEELKQLKEAGEKVVIVDTRPAADYSATHVPGAVNIPYSPLADPIEREITLSALPQDTLLVLYCDWIDDSTSALVALELADLRYDSERVKALKGGILRWCRLNYPVESS